MKLVMETIRRHRVAIDALVKLIPQEALRLSTLTPTPLRVTNKRQTSVVPSSLLASSFCLCASANSANVLIAKTKAKPTTHSLAISKELTDDISSLLVVADFMI